MRIKYNGHILTKAGLVGSAAYTGEQPGPSLPPYTIRLKFNEGVTPTFSKGTGVQVSSSPNIWDLTYENSSWLRLLYNQFELLEVIGANTTGVNSMSNMFNRCLALTKVPLFDTSLVENMSTMFYGCALVTVPLFDTSSAINMASMFSDCAGLTSVPLFNTSSVTNMSSMFRNCTSLTTIPLFNTSSVTRMTNMFYGCINVQSGALALYQQASNQATVSEHTNTFTNCGRDTVTGAAELAQIPTSWGGTME